MTPHKTLHATTSSGTALSESDLPDHLLRWLEAVKRRMSADLGNEIAKTGQFLHVRGGERRILLMIPAGGQIRITDLAAVAGMTKQALGEFVDRLEDAGFVQSSKDASDGRVRLISRTDRGDVVALATDRAIAAVESHWRGEIGDGAYDAMMSALRKLGHGFSIG
ncbi:MAG TPA: MarR family winged helix-turn-helix transcriptional regulator [Streptosporangiaceae bacterium]|jgi:DNA-binding MarR family transcriptional regulator|nr:MarR family winged helix-turn-helix transcriptional regulator [Streptosporangiaceae bacterium]